jgi:hypothetical protein
MEKLQQQRQVAVIHTGEKMGLVEEGLLTSESNSMKDNHK